MGACVAVSLGLILEDVVIMGFKDHIAGAINDTIIWICSNVIREIFDGCDSVFVG